MIGIIALCAIIFVEGILALYALLRRGYDSSNKHTNHYKHIRDQATKVEPEETRPEPEPEYESNDSGTGSLASFISAIVGIGVVLAVGIAVLSQVQEATNTLNITTNGTGATDIINVFNNSTALATVPLMVLAAGVIIGILVRVLGAAHND